MKLQANGKIDAMAVIKQHGFVDTTPDISLCTKKIFIKDGNSYRFNGWADYHNHNYKSVELLPIK